MVRIRYTKFEDPSPSRWVVSIKSTAVRGWMMEELATVALDR
jgi:hypothetical protein